MHRTDRAGVTRELASFIDNPDPAFFTAEALDTARLGIVDTLATTLRATGDPAVQPVLRFTQASDPVGGTVRSVVSPRRFSAQHAALVGGTAGHALDYDDVAIGGHPSTVLAPAILAASEMTGANGLDALKAYVAGYQVWGELRHLESDSLHAKGWHPTPVLGVMGATAAVSLLLKLDREIAAHALGIACSMAAGVVANFGSMTKPLHAGLAAACAINAAMLARAGVTASSDAIEHPSGFLAAFSPRGNFRTTLGTDATARTPMITRLGLSIKRYPVCYAGHRLIDASITLAQQHHLAGHDIETVRVEIGQSQAAMLRNSHPHTELEAKFSAQFAIAAAIIDRRVGFEQLTYGFIHRADVRCMFDKVRVRVVDTQCPFEPALALTDRVRITTKDGRMLDSGPVRFARGNSQNPLTREELRSKFLDCAAGRVADPERFFEEAWNMRGTNLSTIYELAHQRPAPVPDRDTGFDPGFTTQER